MNYKTFLALVAVLLVPAVARCTTFGFTGASDIYGPIFGTYSFDPLGIPDQSGRYFFSGPGYGMTFNIGDLSFDLPNLEIRIFNDQTTGSSLANPPLADSYFVRGVGVLSDAQFFLHDCFGTALDSAALPLIAPNVAAFRPSCAFGDEIVAHGPGILNFAAGNLTSLFLAPVPEPASWLLIAFGLVAARFIKSSR